MTEKIQQTPQKEQVQIQTEREIEIELRQQLVEHEEKLIAQLQEAIQKRDYEQATNLATELQKHVKADKGEKEKLPRPTEEDNMETQETSYEFIDMSPFIRAENLQERYYAGQQLAILEDAFDVEWIVQEKDDDYQGHWFCIFRKDDRLHLVNGYFGSCCGCDSLADSNPVEWLQDYVKNVRAFQTKKDAVKWLQETEDYSYFPIKDRLIDALR